MKSKGIFLFLTLLIFALGCETAGVGTYYPSDMAKLNLNRDNGGNVNNLQSIIERGLAKRIENSVPQEKTASFSTDDQQACSYVKFNLSGNHIFKWNWYMPNGNSYISSEKLLKEGEYPKEGIIYNRISIKKEKAEKHPGEWRVDVTLDGKRIDSRSFSIGSGSILKTYFWGFDKPAKWEDTLATRFEDEFRENIQRMKCVMIFERTKIEKLLNHKNMEKEMRRIEDISTDDLKELKKGGATSVIFGKIDEDIDAGIIKVKVVLYEFSHLEKGNESISIPIYEKNNPAIRQSKMKELSEKLCQSIIN